MEWPQDYLAKHSRLLQSRRGERGGNETTTMTHYHFLDILFLEVVIFNNALTTERPPVLAAVYANLLIGKK